MQATCHFCGRMIELKPDLFGKLSFVHHKRMTRPRKDKDGIEKPSQLVECVGSYLVTGKDSYRVRLNAGTE